MDRFLERKKKTNDSESKAQHVLSPTKKRNKNYEHRMLSTNGGSPIEAAAPPNICAIILTINYQQRLKIHNF